MMRRLALAVTVVLLVGWMSWAEGGLRLGGDSLREKIVELNTSSSVGAADQCSGAADGEIHYENGTLCDGDADLTFNDTTNGLDANGHVAVGAQATVDEAHGFVSETIDNYGVSQDSAFLTVNETITGTNTGPTGLRLFLKENRSATSSEGTIGTLSDVEIASGNSQTYNGKILGFFANVTHRGTGTLAVAQGLRAIVQGVSSGRTSNMYGAMIKVRRANTSDNQAGLYISDNDGDEPVVSAGGKIGLYIEPHEQGSSALNAANIVSVSDTAEPYWKSAYHAFAGPTTIGANGLPTTVNAFLWIRGDGGGGNSSPAGTISTTGTTVTGSSTSFDTGSGGIGDGPDPSGGDVLTTNASSKFRLMTVASSTTAATIDRAFIPDVSAVSYGYSKPLFRWELDGDMYQDATTRGGVINALGNVGIHTLVPRAVLDVVPRDYATGTGKNNVEYITTRSNTATLTVADGITLATQRSNQFLAPTWDGIVGGGTETITDAATLYIDQGPITGNNITLTNAWALWVDAGISRFDGPVNYTVQTLTIADDATLASSPAGTLTPTGSYADIDCQDADGCTVAISETGAKQGNLLIINNKGTNTATINDTGGQSETTAPILSTWDTATLIYVADRWVQTATSNN